MIWVKKEIVQFVKKAIFLGMEIVCLWQMQQGPVYLMIVRFLRMEGVKSAIQVS